MKAWILDESPGDYRYGEIDLPEPGPGEVRVRVVASALNHMDLWLTRGLPKPHLPHVPGCDVAGVVDAVGEGIAGMGEGGAIEIGTEVVVNPSVSCRRCRWCLAGDSPLCDGFQIVGEQRWGGHGTHVVVPAENVLPRPVGRSWEECAAYPLAWVTAWRMLRRSRLAAGETLLVVGVGGGVSSAGLALGVAMGARVFATSRDASKRAAAVAAGAADAFDSDQDFPVKADVVFENVGPATWTRSMKALRKGGRLVTCGGTSGPKVEVTLPRLFFGQYEIIGSTMGSYEEFAQVTDLVAGGLPVLVDEVIPLAEYPRALERLESGAQLGKIVLSH